VTNTRRFTQLDDVWPAGIGRRLGAMLYDGFLVMAIWIAVTVAHLAFFRFVLGQTAEEIGTTAVDIWSLRLMLLFFVTLFFVSNPGWSRDYLKAEPDSLRDGLAVLGGLRYRLLVGAVRWAA